MLVKKKLSRTYQGRYTSFGPYFPRSVAVVPFIVVPCELLSFFGIVVLVVLVAQVVVVNCIRTYYKKTVSYLVKHRRKNKYIKAK
jgi:hypothetical protein